MPSYLSVILLYWGAVAGGFLTARFLTRRLSAPARKTAIFAAIAAGLFFFRMGMYAGEVIERHHVTPAGRQLAACRSEREHVIARARQVVLGAVNALEGN